MSVGKYVGAWGEVRKEVGKGMWGMGEGKGRCGGVKKCGEGVGECMEVSVGKCVGVWDR